MKLMLDAHISGRAVGKALVESGHDVRALDSESVLEGMEDPAVLELAFAESRVLVTANVSDFEPLLREWTEEGRSHAGVVLVPSSVPNEAFGVLIRGIRKTLENFSQEDWANRVEWLRR
jgi:nucleoside-diphosphate-sugar epimerase